MFWIFQWEKIIYKWINISCENKFFDFIFPWLEKEIYFLIPLCIFFFFVFFLGRKKEKTFIIWLMFALVSTFAINSKIIKKLVKRVRPPYTYGAGEFKLHLLSSHHIPPKHDYSFPSGHVSFFFALALFTFLSYPKIGLGILMYFLALLMAFSRVYVGVHYPLDVIGGMFVGTIVGGAIFLLKIKIETQPVYHVFMTRFLSFVPFSKEE